MILTRKLLLLDIFLTRSLSKLLAFCELASVNFEPWQLQCVFVHFFRFVLFFFPLLLGVRVFSFV